MKRIIYLLIICTTTIYSSKGSGTLPVELIYFKGIVVDNSISLTWGTATEINNYGYDVEKSVDSINFNRIGFVIGSGNSNSPKDYSFLDTSFENSGTYYYRLKQIDTDGIYKYSDVVKIDIIITGINENELSLNLRLLQNYPNPFNPLTIFEFEIPETQHVELLVYDITGQHINKLVDETKGAGHYKINFNGAILPSGVYFYKLITPTNAITKKFLLLK